MNMGFKEKIYYVLRLVFCPHSPATMEWRMLKLINKERRKYLLAPLWMQLDLRTVARNHSRDMCQKKYFDHVNTRKQSHAERLKSARISEVMSGENLGKVSGYPNPTLKAHSSLMASQGHRKNILDPHFNCVGIGINQCDSTTYYFTQNFAYRQIIFTKKIQYAPVIHSTISIRGVVTSNVNFLIYELEYQKQKIKITGKIEVHKKRFTTEIMLNRSGHHKLNFYIPTKKETIILINSLDIEVQPSWFRKFLKKLI